MELMKKSEIPQRICIDMDEVMADSVSEHLARYNREYGDNITKADLHGKWIWDVVSIDRHPRLEEYLRSDDFFDVLGVMAAAPRVLRQLQQRYEVFIASAAMEVPTSFNGKYRWLEKHFPTMPSTHIVFCGDKGILRADYLIDDNPRQLRRFVGEGILYEAPHNVAVTGYRRVKSWLDIEKLFLADK
jgi:5'(3')-deoxyribonucleotidase